MPHKLTCALLAAAALTLAAAPAAHAKWITGNNHAPIFTDDPACRNGMAWSYAAVSWPPPPQFVLRAHSLSTDVGLAPSTPPQLSQRVAFTLFRPIPPQQRVISGILPASEFLPGRANVFDFSGGFVIPFDRMLMPGTQLRMRWLEPDGTWIGARYTVRNCFYISAPSQDPPFTLRLE